MQKYRLGILGTTGAVGQEMLKVLQEKDFPLSELRLLASKRSAGKEVQTEKYGKVAIQEATDDSFEGLDFVLGAAENDISVRFTPAIKASGATYIDNSSAYRLAKLLHYELRRKPSHCRANNVINPVFLNHIVCEIRIKPQKAQHHLNICLLYTSRCV